MNYFLLKEYFSYWLHRLEEHSLQSPFVYDLYTNVIKPANSNNIQKIEDLRRQLLADNTLINTRSFGALSTINESKQRTIRSITNKGISSRKFSEFYTLLGKYFELKNVWELGTSLGINTLYLASIPGAKVTTFEGCQETLQVAKNNFNSFGMTNISAIEGSLDETLSFELGKTRDLDLVFFDANHRYEPTIRYFESCLEKTHAASIFIFDDIHWSGEMKKAWNEIIAHPLSRITLDLFQSGIVFFDPELPKQHFVLDF